MPKAEVEKLAANALEAEKARNMYAEKLEKERAKVNKLTADMDEERRIHNSDGDEIQRLNGRVATLEGQAKKDAAELVRKSELIKRAVECLQEHKRKLAAVGGER